MTYLWYCLSVKTQQTIERSILFRVYDYNIYSSCYAHIFQMPSSS